MPSIEDIRCHLQRQYDIATDWLRAHPVERFRIAVGAAVFGVLLVIIMLIGVFHTSPIVGQPSASSVNSAPDGPHSLEALLRAANIMHSRGKLTDADRTKLEEIKSDLSRFKAQTTQPSGPQKRQLAELDTLVKSLEALK